MTFKSVRHLAGFTIKPLLGVMFVLGALLPAAPAGAIVGGQPDGNGHRMWDFSTPVRSGGPTDPRVLISPTVLLTAGHVTQKLCRPEPDPPAGYV